MWLELIQTLIEETNMNYLDSDLPLSVFMMKLLHSVINFDEFFVSTDDFKNYLESIKSVELRYFIQYTIKNEIEEECKMKDKEIEDELDKLDEMFLEYHDEQPIKVMPSYENRLILYKKYLEPEIGGALSTGFKPFLECYTLSEVHPGSGRVPSAYKDLENYYEHFRAVIKYKIHPIYYRKLEKKILQILNKFNTEEDFIKLLKSIRDVIRMRKSESLWASDAGTHRMNLDHRVREQQMAAHGSTSHI